MCKHEIIDNGTRTSECRKCRQKAVLHGFNWVVEETQLRKASESGMVIGNLDVVGMKDAVSYKDISMPPTGFFWRANPNGTKDAQVSFDGGVTWVDSSTVFGV